MKPSECVAKKIRVTIDDQNVFNAWRVEDKPVRWLVPYFEKEAADKVARLHSCTYDASKDAYEHEQDDLCELFEGLVIETVAGSKKVYAIGGGSWVWDEAA